MVKLGVLSIRINSWDKSMLAIFKNFAEHKNEKAGGRGRGGGGRRRYVKINSLYVTI